MDWKALKARKVEAAPLFAVLFGCSGSGKSSALGTLNMSTLVLHGSVESHAAVNAKTMAADPELVTGLDYTVRNEDGTLNHNQSYKNLLSILREPQLSANFEAVAFDSLTELQSVVAETAQFREMCTNERGKFNKFAEGDAYIKMMGDVINALLALTKRGVHVVATCAAVIKSQDETGESIEAKPMLQGFAVADGIARSFSDVLFVNLTRGEDGAKHKLMFQPSVGVASKGLDGKVTKMSFANFSPRLSGFKREDLPETSDVDLAKIVKARAEKVGGQ